MEPPLVPASTGSTKAITWLVSALFIIAITGGATWFYFRSTNSTPEVATTATVTTTTTTTTEPTITSAPTDISSAVSQLDKELTVIGQDEQSDDDTIDL